MNRQELFDWVRERYSVGPDFPWHDENAVFRHTGNRKWFGVVLRVRYSQLGLNGEELLDVLNVKCDPLLNGTMRQRPGIHPAYHMNRAYWLSLRLDGSAREEDIRFLLEQSWKLTAGK